MKSSRSKLLHEVAGHSLLSYAVTAATAIQPERIVVVVGHQRDQVQAHLAEIAPHVQTAVQEQQLRHRARGPGRARTRSADLGGEVIVTYGDVPMLGGRPWPRCWPPIATARPRSPCSPPRCPTRPATGGSCADADDLVEAIVEHADADDEQRAITEINSGIYVFDADDPADGPGQI